MKLVALLALGFVPIALALHEFVRRRRQRELEATLVHTWGQDSRTSRARRPVEARFEYEDDGAGTDDKTWHDLEMDAVFRWADRTLTALGAQVLYGWMRTPCADFVGSARRLAQARRLSADPAERARVQAVLVEVGDGLGWNAVDLLQEPAARSPVPLSALRALTVGLLAAGIAAFVWPSMTTISFLVACILANLAVHGVAAPSVHHSMQALRDIAELVSAAQRVRMALPHEFAEQAADVDAARALVRAGGLSLRRRGAGVGSMFELLLEYGTVFLLAELRAHARVVRALEASRPAVRRTLRRLGEIDAALSLAHLVTHESGLSEPSRLQGDPRLVARGVVHPLLTDGIANEVSLGPRGLLVTGSNMAGKSTFLRTVGVAVLLGQTLGVTRAEALACSSLRVVASMGADDALGAVSLYQAEVLRVRTILEEVERGPCLVLLDEVFRGTNPRERVAASAAVLRAVARNGVVLAATHDLELAPLTAGQLDVGHFSERVVGANVVFDYRLREGLTRRTNALALLGRLGFPASVVADAEHIAMSLGSAEV